MKRLSFLLRHGIVVAIVVGIAITYVYREQMFPRFFEQQAQQAPAESPASESQTAAAVSDEGIAASTTGPETVTDKSPVTQQAEPQLSEAGSQIATDQQAGPAETVVLQPTQPSVQELAQTVPDHAAPVADEQAEAEAVDDAKDQPVSPPATQAQGLSSDETVDAVEQATTSTETSQTLATKSQQAATTAMQQQGDATEQSTGLPAEADELETAVTQMDAAAASQQPDTQAAMSPGGMMNPMAPSSSAMPGNQSAYPAYQDPAAAAPGMQPQLQTTPPAMPAPPSPPGVARQAGMSPQQQYYQLINKARHAYWQGQYQQSIAHYQLAIKVMSANADAYGELGNVFYTQGEWDKAGEQFYQAALRLLEEGRVDKASHLLLIIQGLRHERASALEQRLQQQAAGQ